MVLYNHLVLVTLCNYIPVDDRPYVLDVVCTAILIAEVVSMFPNVNTHDWTKSAYDRVAAIIFLSNLKVTFSISS